MSIRRAAILWVLAAAVAFGCGDKKDSAEPPSGKSYTVRGKVDRVDADGKTVYIHHEEITAFENAFGETRPMKPMTMGFATGGVSLDGIAAGDPVEMTFHTDWKAKPALRLDAIKKLPPDTKLAL